MAPEMSAGTGIWSEAELRARGHETVAPDLPIEDDTAGSDRYADVVIEAIGGRQDEVVVAQSFGGYVAPIVADRIGARLIVLVAAMVPRPGETADEMFRATRWEPARLDEDEAPNRALLRAVVERASDPAVRASTLLEAPDPATARQVLSSEPVDLVLLDVRLPDGNGLDLARDIRQGVDPRPEVIVMSASVLPSERDAALETEARAFLSKPYVPSDLVALVAKTLAGA